MRPPDFDALYAADEDPWRVRSSWYERRKLEIVLSCLTRPRYARAWDPSSGVGELPLRLAERCDRVLASDTATRAVALTRDRCADRTEIEVRHLTLPEAPPPPWRGFDLVVLAEFLYYLGEADRRASVQLLHDLTAERAEVLAVHWRHHPDDAWLSGADVQADIRGQLIGSGWQATVHHEDQDFVLDVLQRGR